METIIKGEMIQWARERAGLSPEELAEKFKISSEKVKKWESGELAITVTKAKALAKISLVPYGLLFADSLPEEKLPIADFRTQGSDFVTKPSPELLETISDARLKQEWFPKFPLKCFIEANPDIQNDSTGHKTKSNLKVVNPI